MACSQGEEVVNPVEESRGVILPQQIMQKNPQRVEPRTGSPAKFAVNGLGLEGIALPCFQLVDGVSQAIVTADQPQLPRRPFLGLFLCPAIRVRFFHPELCS